MRARTRPGRLGAFTRWLELTEPGLTAAPGTLVDVGFGVSAVTTAEFARAFPQHRVIGLELDEWRVERARLEFPGLDVRAGGLEGLAGEAGIRVVRIANVARGLTRPAAEALVRQAHPLVSEGGLVLEGSTDLEGHVTAFHQWRRAGGELLPEALVLHTDGARGFSPWMFRDVLPRALRRDVKPGTAIHAFLTDWDAAWRQHRDPWPSIAFGKSARALSQVRSDVDARLADTGFVVWRR